MFGVGESRNVARYVRGVVAREVLIQKGKGEAKHERQSHMQPQAYARMAEVYAQTVAHACTGCAHRVEGERSQKKSSGSADSQG